MHLRTEVTDRLSNLKENYGAIVVQLILHPLDASDILDEPDPIYGAFWTLYHHMYVTDVRI